MLVLQAVRNFDVFYSFLNGVLNISNPDYILEITTFLEGSYVPNNLVSALSVRSLIPLSLTLPCSLKNDYLKILNYMS